MERVVLVRVFSHGTVQEYCDTPEPPPFSRSDIHPPPTPRRPSGNGLGTIVGRNAWEAQVGLLIRRETGSTPRYFLPRRWMTTECRKGDECPRCQCHIGKNRVCGSCGYDRGVPSPITVAKDDKPLPPLE